jgi:hypothetical protein
MSDSDPALPARVTTLRLLNDAFRRTLTGGQIVVTPGVQALAPSELRRLIGLVRRFDLFEEDNDSLQHHDFGAVDLEGERYFFKIDYYDLTLEFGSDDPADPTKTTRVLTLMRADEY